MVPTSDLLGMLFISAIVLHLMYADKWKKLIRVRIKAVRRWK